MLDAADFFATPSTAPFTPTLPGIEELAANNTAPAPVAETPNEAAGFVVPTATTAQKVANLLDKMNPEKQSVASRSYLVRLAMRRTSLRRCDNETQKVVREQIEDESATVYQNLFKSPGNLVREYFRRYYNVYTVHRRNSSPHEIKGMRVIGEHNFDTFVPMIRQHIEDLGKYLEVVEPRYEDCITEDIAFRTMKQKLTQGNRPVKPITRDEYPSFDEIRQGTSLSLEVLPMPQSNHFLYGTPQSEIDAFNANQKALESLIRADAAARVMEPLTHLLEKLAVPIGTKVLDEKTGKETKEGIFRDVTITNISDAIAEARATNLLNDPTFNSIIDTLESKFKRYEQNPHFLRESPFERAQALSTLSAVEQQLKDFSL